MILFRDAELEVEEYLKAGLGTARPIGSRIPNPKPNEFYRLFRTGGPRETLVTDAAHITVEAWAKRETVAADMLNQARSLLFAAEGTVFGVNEFGGPANLPDPTTAHVRYTASFTIRIRTLV